jgi:Mor family transcriptional regulator
MQQDIPYTGISIEVFKTRLKRHLMAIQSQYVAGEDYWLPCNHDIFPAVKI